MADSVFLHVDVDDVTSGFPVFYEGHVRQKYSVPLALPYHSFDRVARKNRGVSVSQFTCPLQIKPGELTASSSSPDDDLSTGSLQIPDNKTRDGKDRSCLLGKPGSGLFSSSSASRLRN
jgi:hypothetical protein